MKIEYLIQQYSIWERLQQYLSEFDFLMISIIYPGSLEINSLHLLNSLLNLCSNKTKPINIKKLKHIIPYVPKDIVDTFLSVVVQNWKPSLRLFEQILQKCNLSKERAIKLLTSIINFTNLGHNFAHRFYSITKVTSMSDQQIQEFFIRYDIKKIDKWEKLCKVCDFVEYLRKDFYIDFQLMPNAINPTSTKMDSHLNFYRYKYELLIFGESLKKIKFEDERFDKNASCVIH